MIFTSLLRILSRAAIAMSLLLLVAISSAAFAQDVPKGDIVSMKIKLNGEEHWIKMQLEENAAPRHCANFKILAEGNYYTGMGFHRVIRDYLVQTGDPLTKKEEEKRNWGTGGVGYDIPPEIGLPHKRGAVGMARLRGSNPKKRSSGTQFYIMLTNADELDADYTVFGYVTEGLDIVGRMSRARADTNDVPVNRIEIVAAIIGEPGILNSIPNPIAAIPKPSMPEISMPKVGNPLKAIPNPFAKKDPNADIDAVPSDTEIASNTLESDIKSEPVPKIQPPAEGEKKRFSLIPSLPRSGGDKDEEKAVAPPKKKDDDFLPPSQPAPEAEKPAAEKERGPLGRLIKKIW